ncbi:NTP transferase domain-containing protein [Tepidiforma flava]|uniref:NTP transferase domain-containing protein n=1 Tax=Tepidiforma flava TaxID=3004094 RepID=A0ABY7M4P6_9CHLR|nr:NTP transferase domain-containing protein [Tepidiforma flava]WBL34751.1 NTP transferase domain-containing protein [Tepidiforma flava]
MMDSEISIPMKTPQISVSQPIVCHMAVHPPVGLRRVSPGALIVTPPAPTRDAAAEPLRYLHAQRTAGQQVKAVILAAGDGGRLGHLTRERPKPLVELAGRPIIAYTLEALAAAGIRDVAVILGYRAAQLGEALAAAPHGLALSFIYNARFREGASLSLAAARHWAGSDPFLLLMADHLLSAPILRRLVEARAAQPAGVSLVAADAPARWPEDYRDEATRLALDPERFVTAIGKRIEPYDALDTGAFLLDPAAWRAVDAAPESCELSAIFARLAAGRTLRAVDIGGAHWYDIDTGADLEAAEALLAARQ